MLMQLCNCICRQTCLGYVFLYVGIYVCIDIHRWEGEYIFMEADMHEYVCMYIGKHA